MTSDTKKSIKRLCERIDTSDKISDDDAEALRKMDDSIRILGPSEIGLDRHEFLLMRTVKMAEEVGGLAEVLEDKKAAERVVKWIHSTKTNSAETNKDYRDAIRNFGRHATEGDDFPESVAWIPAGYPSNYDPAPDPAEMLRWKEEILPMIDSCYNQRDRALIAFDWDLGPRPGELFDLTVGTITDHTYGLQVTLDGKTGRRSPFLVNSVPYVQQWLQDHPGSDDPDAPLFCKKTSTDSISNNRIRDILKEVADRAGVNKPVTPSNFRKSSASHLASKGVSQRSLEQRYGWTRGSDVVTRYIAVFSDASDREIADAYGVDVDEEEPDPTAPRECPRCSRKTPREKEFCIRCKQALDPTAVESLREREDEVRTAALKLTKENPDVVEEIQQAQNLMRLFEANPELFAEAQDFAEALSESDS